MPTTNALDLRPMTPTIGALLADADLRKLVEPGAFANLKEELTRWKVLFLRNQSLTQEELIKVGSAFGPLEIGHPLYTGTTKHPEIYRLDAQHSLDQIHSRPITSASDDVSNAWHSDMTFSDTPPLLSVLYGVTIPPYGGDTVWTNLQTAFAALSPPMKSMLRELTAVHRWRSGFERDVRPGATTARHPLVSLHPVSGEETLWVNRLFTSHIPELTPSESATMLDFLCRHITKPQFCVRFQWEPNSVAIWDNRATAHLALSTSDLDGTTTDRVLDRVTVRGDQVRGANGMTSQRLEDAKSDETVS